MSENRSNPMPRIRAGLFAAVVSLALSGAAAPARAADTRPDPGLGSGNDRITVLHLTERAERQIKADRLQATLRADASGPDAVITQGRINQAMAAALARAKAAVGVVVETGSYSVYEDRPQNAPVQWHGSQSLTLRGTDADAVLALVGNLQNSGLAMAGMTFDLAPETGRSAEDALTDAALDRIGKRAKRIADALDLTMIRLRDVRVGNVNDGQQRSPMPMLAKMTNGASPIVAPSAEAGVATVQVTVEAEILLGPRAIP